MSRTRTGAALVLLALASLALPSASAGDSSAPTWEGVWDSSFGRMTLSAGGGGSYEGFNPGTVSGPATGRVNEGTWNQPGERPKSGTYKWTMSGDGLSFSGDWAYDEGGCGTGCGWSGTCIEGACLKNNEAPPANEPEPGCTPRGDRAFVAITYCPFAYGASAWLPAPDRGEILEVSAAGIPKDTYRLILELVLEEEAAKLAAAITARLKEPGGKEFYDGCLLFGEGIGDPGDSVNYDELINERGAALTAACGELLLRQKAFGGNPAQARSSAKRCTAIFVPAFAKGKATKKRRRAARAAARRQLKLACGKPAPRRTTISVKARRRKATLSGLLGKRVRTPLAAADAAGQRVNVRWQAKKR